MPRLWIDAVINDTVSTGTPILRSLMEGVTTAQTRLNQMTLLRTIIGLDLARTVHDSGEGSEAVSIGIGVASQDAFNAGTGSVPNPGVSADFPTRGWVWRQRYRIWGFAADQPAIFTRRLDLDIRSQRKLENGESFLHATLINVEGANSTINMTGTIRQLWLVG